MTHFKVNPLTGVGKGKIAITPETINDSGNPITGTVEITAGINKVTLNLTHKAKLAGVWGAIFSISPDTIPNYPSGNSFKGDIIGESTVIQVTSYLQKYIDSVPQEEYQPLDWSFRIIQDDNWLIPLKETSNNGGTLTLTTSKTNDDVNGNGEPISRNATVQITQMWNEIEVVKELIITQGPGKITYKWAVDELLATYNTTNQEYGVEVTNWPGYRHSLINGKLINNASIMASFRISSLNTTLIGQGWSAWCTGFNQQILNNYVELLTGAFHVKETVPGSFQDTLWVVDFLISGDTGSLVGPTSGRGDLILKKRV